MAMRVPFPLKTANSVLDLEDYVNVSTEEASDVDTSSSVSSSSTKVEGGRKTKVCY